jgi:hypothetical protein
MVERARMKIYRKHITLLTVFLLIFINIGCKRTANFKVEISRYPDGKDFAFTITDDPDYSNLEDKIIIYNFLDSLGFKTTVPVWVSDNLHGSGEQGTLTNTRGIATSNPNYLQYIQGLQEKGFEICLHTVSPGNDLREETLSGYELFKQQFGHYPNININHANNLENIYWGGDRFSNPFMKYIYSLIEPAFEGNKVGSRYFLGDILKSKTKYVRGWATDNINTLSVNKSMPYHLQDKPYVNYWFGCSDGYNYDKFMKLISDKNMQRLVSERGTSIIYTHFAYGFIDKGSNSINKTFKANLKKISQLNGWFVPVSNILDRFLLLRDISIIEHNNYVVIVNNSDQKVDGLTIFTDQKKLYLFNNKEWVISNPEGKIILGDLQPFAAIKLGTQNIIEMNYSPGTFERIKLVWDWFLSRLNK